MNHTLPTRLFFGAICLLLVASTQVPADEATKSQTIQSEKPRATKTDSSDFIRLRSNAKQVPLALESSIVHLAKKNADQKAFTVDLVSAVHIGEKSYYDELNKAFEKYDVVLYELVAPSGTRIPKGGKKSESILSKIQKLMKDTLDLEFQLDRIDYTKSNFVHADMSPDEFAKSMTKKGESWFTMFYRMMSYSMTQQAQGKGGVSDMDILFALLDKNRSMALKRVMAKQFQEMDGMLEALEGPQGSTLITERNKIAINELRKQVEKGKRKIAIFYGGGHMPDLQKRLRDEFGLSPTETRWLTAWNLEEKPKPAAKKPK